MAYEELGSVDSITLGGINKETGKANPTQIEGYLVNVEQRPNKFNPSKPQNFYIFKTRDGLKGVFAKAGIDSVLKGATLGAMTKLVATGEVIDTGKGNPMKVFKAYQDKSNVADTTAYSSAEESSEPGEDDDYSQVLSEAGYVEDEAPVVHRQPTRPAIPAKTPSSDKIAAMQALLKNRSPKSI